MLSLCLLLAISSNKDKDNILRANLLLKSLSLFSEQIYDIYIVTPRNSFNIVNESLLKFGNLNYIYYFDDQICNDIDIYKIDSWHKQQYLKLAISKYIKTKFYLLLDADIICINYFDDKSFILNEKAYMNYESASFHHNWYSESCKILQLKEPSRNDIVMGVTPNIMSVALSQDLLDHLQTVFKMNPDRLLLCETKAFWTEYSLYYMFNKYINKKIDKYYINYNESNRYQFISPHSLWKKATINELHDLSLKKLSVTNSIFICIQSLAKLPLEEIYLKFGEIFYNKIHSVNN